MADCTRDEDCGGSGGGSGVAERAVRTRLRRVAGRGAAYIAAALMIGLAVGYFALRDKSASGPSDTAQHRGVASDSTSPPPEWRAASPRPTVVLASMAVPATAEQLQQEAEAVANQLRDRFPNLVQALHVVAMLDAQLRQTAKAEELWRKCIELDPKEVRYYVNLAAVAMDRGNSESAVETLEQAIDAGCSSPDVYHHLAVALAHLGRCDEAEDAIKKALADYPEAPAYWLVLGQSQLKLKKPAEAETSLKKAIALGSRSADAYFALSNACARQGKQEEAAEYRKRFTELKGTQKLDPQQRYQILSAAEARRMAVTVLTEAAAICSTQGDSLESERLLLRAVALDPAGAETCRALARLYQGAGMIAEERVVRRRLVEIEPQNLANYLDWAKACGQLGEPESAEATLKLALAMSPNSVDVYATLAQFYLQEGKARKARWFAQEAVRREPTAEGYLFLASTCRLLGDQAAAEAAMARVRELAPDDPRFQGPAAQRP